mmetsp:Transcript_664/g.2221  ORF Transcript_664/g.2221 Transcript_664/m.2221 type:complete len:249 (-) Transcript_664:34-780(-)
MCAAVVLSIRQVLSVERAVIQKLLLLLQTLDTVDITVKIAGVTAAPFIVLGDVRAVILLGDRHNKHLVGAVLIQVSSTARERQHLVLAHAYLLLAYGHTIDDPHGPSITWPAQAARRVALLWVFIQGRDRIDGQLQLLLLELAGIGTEKLLCVEVALELERLRSVQGGRPVSEPTHAIRSSCTLLKLHRSRPQHLFYPAQARISRTPAPAPPTTASSASRTTRSLRRVRPSSCPLLGLCLPHPNSTRP